MRKSLISVARVQYRSWSFNVDVPSDVSSPFPFLSLFFCSLSLDILDSLDRSGPDINLLWTIELNKPRVYLKLYLIVLTLFNDGKYGLLMPTRGKVTTLYGQRKWWCTYVYGLRRILSFVIIIIIITRPKPAYSRQGLDWILGPGYSFVVVSTDKTMETNQKPWKATEMQHWYWDRKTKKEKR